MNRFERFEAIIGNDNLNKLKNKKVLVVGVGGVGGMAAITLARSGIGRIDLVDFDTVSITNINRQMCAYSSTIGKFKVDVIRNIMLDINPNIKCNTYPLELDERCIINVQEYDYVIDAIDNVKAKIALIIKCIKHNVKIISSMGAGMRLDPSKVGIIDIQKTHDDPLAKAVRLALRKENINHLDCVFSLELPGKNYLTNNGKIVPASSPFVPNAFGLCAAYKVVNELIKGEEDD